MDVVVLGAPGILMSWAPGAVERMARETGAAVSVAHFDRLDDLGELSAADPNHIRILSSQYPSVAVSKAAIRANVPIVIFADEPADAAQYLDGGFKCGVTQALRQISASYSLISVAAPARRRLIIQRRSGLKTATVMREIANFLQLQLTPEALLRAAHEDEQPDVTFESTLERAVAGYASAPLASESLIEVAKVVGEIFDYTLNGGDCAVVWSRESFFSGDKPNETAPLVAPVTGGARIIYYGPYFHLPSGEWETRVIFGFSNDIYGTPFAVEVWGGTLLGKARIRPEHGGIFSLQFSIRHEHPENAIEVRVLNEEGAIEGQIALVEVHFFKKSNALEAYGPAQQRISASSPAPTHA